MKKTNRILNRTNVSPMKFKIENLLIGSFLQPYFLVISIGLTLFT